MSVIASLSIAWDTVDRPEPEPRLRWEEEQAWPHIVEAPWIFDLDLPGAVHARGHKLRSREQGTVFDPTSVANLVDGVDAIVLGPQPVPEPLNEHTARPVATALCEVFAEVAPDARLVIVTYWTGGHGRSHHLNRLPGLRGQKEFEQAARELGLAPTVMRTGWISADEPGQHAIRFSQNPIADGMLAPRDVATAILAAVEHPAARGKTFTAINAPGSSSLDDDWDAVFEALVPDLETVASGEPVLVAS